ncbi:hypothetical protein ABH923_003778 [Leifsonia sp. EB41]
MATRAASADGTTFTTEDPARVTAANTPSAPPMPIRMRPNGGRRSSTQPASAPPMRSTTAREEMRNALSPVPNTPITAFFTQAGVRSMTSAPTTRIGLPSCTKNALSSSAAPTPATMLAAPTAAEGQNGARGFADGPDPSAPGLSGRAGPADTGDPIPEE